MGKLYKNLRIEEEVKQELRKIKNFYELQDCRPYTISQIIYLLIEERKKKQFILPDAEPTKR